MREVKAKEKIKEIKEKIDSEVDMVVINIRKKAEEFDTFLHDRLSEDDYKMCGKLFAELLSGLSDISKEFFNQFSDVKGRK